MAMIGADPEALDGLAAALTSAGADLDRLNRSVEGALRALPWRGPDATRFTQEWQSRHGPAVRKAITTLTGNAATLRRNADEQREASAAGGGSHSGHSAGQGAGATYYDEARSSYFGKELPIAGAKRSTTWVDPLDTDQGIIVARFFIPDKTALNVGFGPDVLRGDNRGFSLDPDAGYRVAVAWNTATGEVSYTVTPSEDGTGKLHPARPIDNKDGANRFEVDERGPGDLKIDYHGLNSRTPVFGIDGTLSLGVQEDGDIKVRITGDHYPSFEAIRYTPDSTYGLGRDDWRDGGPPLGENVAKLLGVLPRDREWINGDEVPLGPPPVADFRPSVGGIDGEAKVWLNPAKVGLELGIEDHHVGISVDPGDVVDKLKKLTPDVPLL
jgi:hypothetical protein